MSESTTKPKSGYRLHVVKSEIAWTVSNFFGINNPSPFIEISLAGKSYVTKTKPSTLTPVWDEQFELQSDDPTSIISINLRKTSKKEATTSIGSTQLSIKKLEKLGIISRDISLDLFDRNYKTAVAIIRFRKEEVHHAQDHSSNTDLNSRKKSVTPQETHKPDERSGNDLQSGTIANENEELKTHQQSEAGPHDSDLANLEIVKQSGELERKIQSEEQMEANEQIRYLPGENQKLKDELSDLQGKHLDTVKLLEERTADLKVAQTFLTTVDRYAGAEIRKMVEDLNDEIFQGAGLVSDLLGDGNAFEADSNERAKNGQLTQGDRDHLTQFIGPKLLEHLSTKSKHQVHPFPLQIAVQTILTRWCVFMVNSFYPGPAGNDLREIYRRIWESEPQAVAGRWRAMMAKQAKHLDSTTQKDDVIKILLNLLCLCGANVSSQQTSLHLHEVVSTILNMWMQLRTAIKEGVTTTEMEIFDANPNAIYQDEVMDVMYAGTKDVQQPDLGGDAGHILCVVGMGLHLVRRDRDGDGRMSIQRDTTLKAKVALPSVLSKFS